MTKQIDSFGKNAGRLWKTLEKSGPSAPNKLIKTTNISEENFYVAIGWLAKENKICKTDGKYFLGDTNLENKIGKDAGKIWKILDTIGYVDEPYIPKLARISNRDTYIALGWLAREGKLNIKKVKPTKPQTKYGLK